MHNLTPHSVNDLDNFIAGWYDPDMAKLSDLIIDFYTNSPDKVPGRVYKNGESKSFDSDKISTEVALTQTNPLTAEYFRLLQKVTDAYIQKYPWSNAHSPWSCIQSPNIQHYKPSEGYFVWHTERGMPTEPIVSRHLVFMTYINDVTDAGETEFFHQKIKIKPEKGLSIIWPSDWTFVHRGITSPTQEKYIVTSWFNYINPNR
jgi:hypothetical protein